MCHMNVEECCLRLWSYWLLDSHSHSHQKGFLIGAIGHINPQYHHMSSDSETNAITKRTNYISKQKGTWYRTTSMRRVPVWVLTLWSHGHCSVLDQASTAGLRDVSPSTENIGTSGVVHRKLVHPPLVILVPVDVFNLFETYYHISQIKSFSQVKIGKFCNPPP